MKKEKKKKAKSEVNAINLFINCESEFKALIQNVTCTKTEKKAYFQELYKLFQSSNWKKFPTWHKLSFFRHWFIVISPDYIKAFKLFHELYDRRNQMSDDDPCWDLEDLAKIVFGVSLLHRIDELTDTTTFTEKDVPVRLMNSYFDFQFYANSFKDQSVIKSDHLRFFAVNIKFPIEDSLEKIRNFLEKEQNVFYENNPHMQKRLNRKTKDNRSYSYRFDEWERYLKAYILKQQGKSRAVLAKDFFPAAKKVTNDKDLIDFKRQISRFIQKAKKLSQNAIEGNFLGE